MVAKKPTKKAAPSGGKQAPPFGAKGKPVPGMPEDMPKRGRGKGC